MKSSTFIIWKKNIKRGNSNYNLIKWYYAQYLGKTITQSFIFCRQLSDAIPKNSTTGLGMFSTVGKGEKEAVEFFNKHVEEVKNKHMYELKYK